MLFLDVFAGNENLNVRLRCEIAYRECRILSRHIELLCLARECRYRPRGRQCCGEHYINHERQSPDLKIHNPSPRPRIEGARLRRGWMTRSVSPSLSTTASLSSR